jgi:hypothetical protein
MGKGTTFIRPVYWEEKLARVPSELSHIHFARVDFNRFLEPTGETRPLPRPTPEAERDLMTLTVSTYRGEGEDSTLLARTRISISGDVETHVVGENHSDNESLLTLHHETVREALKTRLAYLEILSGKPRNR